MRAARPTSTTPLVKQEESATEAHNLLHSGNDVSEADVELLLNFRRDSAQARASTPPTSASRVSISALLNSEEDSPSRNLASSHAVTTHPPATPRPSTSISAVNPTHPFPPATNSKSLDMPALASPPLVLERDLDRATKSMSISVEPEVVPPSTIRAPSPLTPRPTAKTKPSKIGKGRGRVSKGPKKRQGKGWIIESCTTSGAASDAELDMDLETGSSESPEQSPEKIPDRKPIVLKQLQELFDGDSDLTDLDDLGGGASSSSDEQTQEYDPGLAGLPPVPASSDSEYAPRNGSTPRVDVGGETRARRISRTSLDYGAFQISARPSVRLATRTPTANGQKREARNKKPQAGDQQGPVRRSRSAPQDVDALLTPSSRTIKRGRGRPRKAKAPSLSASSISLGEWQEDKPDEMAAAKVVRDALKGKGKGKADSGTSTLTELTESSPSLGGGKSIMGSSPVRRLKELVMSDPPNLSARSDGGVTHISGSVGDRNEESEEEERLRRVRKYQQFELDQVSEGDGGEEGIQVRDFVHDEMPPRRMSDPNRRRGSSQRYPSASKPSGSSKLLRRRTSVEVVLPSRPKSRRSSFPQGGRNISPSRARLLPAMVSTGSSNKTQRVYVLLPEPSSAWTSRLTHTTSDASSIAPSEDFSIEESNMEDVSSNGMTVESRSELSEEPPSKRAKRGTSTSSSARQVKGKGVASRRGSTVPRGRGGRQTRLSSRLSESTTQDDMEVIPEDDKLSAIEENPPIQVRRAKKGIIPADTDSLSGLRPRRHSKQTARARESAEQELGWNDEDMPMVVTIKEKPRRGNSSKFVLHVAETPAASEQSSAAGSRGKGKGKGKRSVSAPGEPRPAKRSRKSQAEASPGHALVELREGDYILRPQERRCWNYDFDQTVVSRCVACKKKKFGDTCRFIHVRWFQFKHPSSDPVGVKFESPNGEAEKEEEPKYHLPYQWNATPEIKQVERMRVAIARALYPVLKEELAHASRPNVIRRAIEIEVRATCDVCVTSVFSSCHMCTRCGRELCGACFQRVEDMCPPGTPLEYSGSASKDRQLHKFRACSWGRLFHLPADFQPVTRFSHLELEQTVAEMESIIQEQSKNAPAPMEDSTSHTAQAQIANWASRVPAWNPTSPHASTEPPALSSAGSSRDVSSSRGTPDPQLPTMPIIASPTMSPTHEDPFSAEVGPLPGKRPRVSHYGRLDPASVPSHPVHHFSKTLSEEEFRPLWARGEAIVVQDLLSEFKLNWTPEYFTSEYGEQRCMVVNCTDNKDVEMMVKEFFEMFGKVDREAGILKLKDWPAQADFKDDFPKLYDDFMGALPVPNYTRRDGILNLASHFATNAIAPDLGPKMYNAFTSVEGPGGQGSTRLHMDMADAVNIMMYASQSPDGSPGVAAWDIFRAKDSDKIRAYLRRHFKDRANEFRDPIHSQLFYLDSHHRKKLCDEEQVFSWRIYQRPGDAVFIPAGCAHQVCNLADCIKIAIDFVSIENIDRCEKLTTEFRNENDTFTWKEDVLQLRTMMMYAWRSTTQLRKCWYDELAKLEQGGTSEGNSSDSSHSAAS
ncbi:Jmjd1a protein [Rhizoctonia solani 123E]|uniref:Jmjd1a protein n=1 Tax=Rhizoctonia solani 123E TaxID=1423351 RepID=A0A074RSJ5_9AGAM|nr:Jmjd1a protein [Rhizoctonia solani 123E]